MKKLVQLSLAVFFVFASLVSPVQASLPPAQVFVVAGSDVNIVSRESKIPVSIQNNYDRKVRVRVHARSADPAVTVDKYVSLEIPANSRKDALLPVTFISAGKYKLDVWVTTFTDIRLGETISINLTVNPDIEIVIIIAFGSLIGILVILGAIRMARRGKSEGGL